MLTQWVLELIQIRLFSRYGHFGAKARFEWLDTTTACIV